MRLYQNKIMLYKDGKLHNIVMGHKEPDSFSITYVVDTGNSTTSKVNVGASILDYSPTKSGYTFVGWRADNAANGTVLSGVVATGPTTLYAVFSKTITVTYNANGGSGSTSSSSGIMYYNNGNTLGASITLRSNGFSYSGRTFQKWAMGSASGTQYSAGASVTLTANTTFYAVWKSASQSFKVYMHDHENWGNGWEDLGVRSLDSNNYFSLDSNGIYLTAKVSCSVSLTYTYNNGGGDGRLWIKKYSSGSTTELDFREGDGLSGSGSFSISAGDKIYFQTMSHYATGDGAIIMRTSGLTFTFTATAT